MKDKPEQSVGEQTGNTQKRVAAVPAPPQPAARPAPGADDLGSMLDEASGQIEAEMGETEFTVSGFGGSLSMEVMVRFHKAKVGPFLTHVLQQVLATWAKDK